MERRCSFCSDTDRPGLSFYKGLLGALICSECVRAIMKHAMVNMVSQMDFTQKDE